MPSILFFSSFFPVDLHLSYPSDIRKRRDIKKKNLNGGQNKKERNDIESIHECKRKTKMFRSEETMVKTKANSHSFVLSTSSTATRSFLGSKKYIYI